jgi:hypothetical protein
MQRTALGEVPQCAVAAAIIKSFLKIFVWCLPVDRYFVTMSFESNLEIFLDTNADQSPHEARRREREREQSAAFSRVCAALQMTSGNVGCVCIRFLVRLVKIIFFRTLQSESAQPDFVAAEEDHFMAVNDVLLD